MQEAFHFIAIENLSNSKKIKIRSLFFRNDYFTIPFNKYIDQGPLIKAIEILEAGGFKIKGYGIDAKGLKTYYIAVSTTFQEIKPLQNLYKTLGENPFKSLKVTAQRPTNQKPLKKYKRCI